MAYRLVSSFLGCARRFFSSRLVVYSLLLWAVMVLWLPFYLWPRVLARAPRAADPPREPRALILGDSIGAGIWQKPTWWELYNTVCWRGPRYRWDSSLSGLGYTSADLLRQLRLVKGRYALVVISVGFNDAWRGVPPAVFSQRLLTLLQGARRHAPCVLLLAPHDPLDAPGFCAPYRAVAERTARAAGCLFAPVALPADARFFWKDRIHPVGYGAAAIAAAIDSALYGPISEPPRPGSQAARDLRLRWARRCAVCGGLR